MVSLERNWCNPSSEMSLPSMEIRPAVDSMSLKSAKVRLLLPAPVRPPERYQFDYPYNKDECCGFFLQVEYMLI